MTLHLLLLTVTINKRRITTTEAAKQERIEKLYDEYKDKQISLYQF
ncbi:YrzI family small protein [Neobacillus sp. Marseille-QA0830]